MDRTRLEPPHNRRTTDLVDRIPPFATLPRAGQFPARRPRPREKRPRTAPKLRNVLYPTPIGRSGALAWVEYTPDGHYTIVAEDSLRQRTAWPMPGFSEVHGLAWDNATERLYTLVTDDSGMWIGRIEPGEGLQAVTRGAYITLSDLRAADGKLYYGSIASGP